MNNKIYFDEMTHTYLHRDTGEEYKGVTTVLREMGVMGYPSSVPLVALQKAASRGTAVHLYCSQYIKGEKLHLPEELADYTPIAHEGLTAFKALDLKDITGSEVLIYDEVYSIATMVDITYSDGLADIKTTRVPNYTAVTWQIAVEEFILSRISPIKIERREMIHIRSNVAEVVALPAIPMEEVKGLLDAWKMGERYPFREVGKKDVRSIRKVYI